MDTPPTVEGMTATLGGDPVTVPPVCIDKALRATDIVANVLEVLPDLFVELDDYKAAYGEKHRFTVTRAMLDAEQKHVAALNVRVEELAAEGDALPDGDAKNALAQQLAAIYAEHGVDDTGSVPMRLHVMLERGGVNPADVTAKKNGSLPKAPDEKALYTRVFTRIWGAAGPDVATLIALLLVSNEALEAADKDATIDQLIADKAREVRFKGRADELVPLLAIAARQVVSEIQRAANMGNLDALLPGGLPSLK